MKDSTDYRSRLALLLLVCLNGRVWADYEHTCQRRDYLRSPNITMCGRMIHLFITQRCFSTIPEDPTIIYSRSGRSAPGSGVFLPQERANSVLESHTPGTGLICECCVHRCTVRELRQYCDTSSKSTHPPTRRRRSSSILRRSLQLTNSGESQASPITESDVNKVYSLLSEMQPYAKSLNRELTTDESLALEQLDQQKLKVIQQKQALQMVQEEQEQQSEDDPKQETPQRSHHHHRHHRDRDHKRG